ncbi:MAG TPA: MBL fold metallo-hydrolase [Solirubrobacteraceae bacterium]|jgi:L-ascorbate metabolism protein UlaG (beta-lactamase superfamily)|nr:MBL fold metallo-hydrolase [Solirubrobacteraceae bacterium]
MADGAPLAHRAGFSAEDRIAFPGHATVLIELDGVRLLTDPLLRGRVVHLRRQVPPVAPGVFARPDAVLISHLHHDHLDLASLRLLGLDTPLLVPAGAGKLLLRRGFTDVTELRAGAATGIAGTGEGELTVTAVQARHDGRRHPGGMRAETLGYVMRGRRTVYFAGDTELFDGMSGQMPDPSSQLDVALLPVAGWGSTLGPGHMDPLDAARAVALLAPRIAIPIHWGTLLPIGVARRHRSQLGDPPRLFARHAARLAPEVEVRILQPGQATTLPAV